MKIIDFAELALSDQLELLYKDGVYLSKRRQGFSYVILYQYRNLYVEIFYIRYRAVISHIICGESMNIIEPYLAEINVEELLESF